MAARQCDSTWSDLAYKVFVIPYLGIDVGALSTFYLAGYQAASGALSRLFRSFYYSFSQHRCVSHSIIALFLPPRTGSGFVRTYRQTQVILFDVGVFKLWIASCENNAIAPPQGSKKALIERHSVCCDDEDFMVNSISTNRIVKGDSPSTRERRKEAIPEEEGMFIFDDVVYVVLQLLPMMSIGVNG